MFERIKSYKFNKYDELGIALGMIVGTFFAALLTTSDWMALAADRAKDRIPYGVLWTWLNPYYWTDLHYRINSLILLLVVEGMIYWLFVKSGRLPKFLFYAGWFQNIIWMRGSVFQNITVTMFAPLGALFPWFTIPFMLLQKIPLGWSWNLSDQHWWCAFVGNPGFVEGEYITFENGQKLVLCPGGWLRYDPQYAWLWSYFMIMFWVLFPAIWWFRIRWKEHGTWRIWKW